jgi:hypothetical protein
MASCARLVRRVESELDRMDLMRTMREGLGNRVRRARLALGRHRRKPAPLVPWKLGVDGPLWFAELLGTVADIVPSRQADVVITVPTDQSAADGVPVVVRGAERHTRVIAPFVDDARANPLRRPDVRGLPAAFAALASAASRPPSRLGLAHGKRALGRWLVETRTMQPAYRDAFGYTSRDVVREIAIAAGRPVPALSDHCVTVICVTNRLTELSRIAANFARQRHRSRRLIVILNLDDVDERVVDSAFGDLGDVDVVRVREDRSLGHCLNEGFRRATSRFVAKFDDDDEYGPDYLGDMLLTHRYAAAAVVGKHSYAAYLEASDETVLRAPGREFEYTSHVAGGTLVVDRERTDGIWFPDVSLGEDQAFIRSCERAGLPVCASDRFNYLQRRHRSNTWTVSEERYRRGSFLLGSGCLLDEVFV